MLIVISVMLVPFLLFSQDVRSIDGVGNNIANPEIGAVGDIQPRLSAAIYVDGLGEPLTGESNSKPNPRNVSNKLFAQDGLVSDNLNLSDFTWVFGQFVDHDITQVVNGSEPLLNIIIPDDDEVFSPGTVMPMLRSEVREGSGEVSPREYSNNITSYIDGSNIYGSSDEVAAWLRSYKDGKLNVSEQNLLPWNTKDYRFNSIVDYQAPVMDDDTRSLTKYFVAGDSRANENPLLLTIHTLFLREHNRQCDDVAKIHPGWNDERLYQAARKNVIAILQNIVYNEWLPALGMEIAPYTGYKSEVKAQIFNEFSTAAFRMGHTLINSSIIRMDSEGEELKSGNIELRDAFFNPHVINLAGGIEPYISGMATQVQQDFDNKVIDDVRNFLFGVPGGGGLDLAAININRGREKGLADFNTIRRDLGLPMYNNYTDLTHSDEDVQILKDVYGDISNLDAWVGMLSEKRDEGSLFGKVVSLILEMQFQVLRDGDRFYYANNQFEEEELNVIEQTTMRDIIMRNSKISLMQDEVFTAMPYDQIEEGPELIPFSLDAVIYPNPVSDIMTIKVYGDTEETVSIKILDYLGKIISSDEFHIYEGSNFARIPLVNCPRGYYNVILETDRRYKILKMIKK